MSTISSICTVAHILRVAGGAAALTIFAQSLAAQASRKEATPEKGPLITALQVRGIRHVDRDELLQGLATKASKCRSVLYAPFCMISRSPSFFDRRYLDPLEFRRDVVRIRLFYWRRGYRDAVVTEKTERSGGGVRVIFDVDEKQPTVMQALEVQQSDTVLSKRAINASLRLHAGEPLDLVALDSSIALLRDQLWQRGYADAGVELDTTRVSDAADAGPVAIVIHPGHLTKVDSVEIDGNRKVSDRTINRLINFRSGSLFRRSDVLESQRNLWLSGLFREVEMAAAPGDSQKVVQVRVTEADLNRMEFSTGFTTADFLQFETQFTRYNFLGGARRLTLRGTVSNLFAAQVTGSGMFYDVTNGAEGSERDAFLQPTWSTSIELQQPWFLTPRNELGASVFSHRRSVPGVVIDRGVGATLALTHDFGMRTNSTVGYTYESSAVEAPDVYFCVSFGICVPATIAVVAKRHPLSPVSWVTQFDQTNDAFAPNRGYKARIDVEHASSATLSEFRYNRFAVTGSTYLRMSKTTVLAGRVRLGWVRALRGTASALDIPDPTEERIVHPRKRFYAGGSQSVRGFGENQLGPRALTIPPKVLTDTVRDTPCTTEQLRSLTCDPNMADVPASAFQPRPLGGTSLAEASVEYRFPLSLAQGLTGAVFLDGAIIGGGQFSELLGTTQSITPGFGIRLDTPVGPVRLDLGVRPTLVEKLPVITQVTNADGTVQLVTLKTPRRYDPLDRSGGVFRGIMNRLMLHLAIGPPF